MNNADEMANEFLEYSLHRIQSGLNDLNEFFESSNDVIVKQTLVSLRNHYNFLSNYVEEIYITK